MRIFISILAVLLIGFGIAAYFIADIAESKLHAFLNEKGVPYQSIEVTGITPTSITLGNVSLGQDGEVTAKRITLAYRGGTDLESLRVNVDIEDLGIIAEQRSNGIDLGGVETLFKPLDSSKKSHVLSSIQVMGADVDITGSKAPNASGTITIGDLSFQQPAMVVDVKNVKLRPDLDDGKLTLGYDIASLQATIKDKTNPKTITAPLAIKGTANHTLGADALKHDSMITAIAGAFELAVKGTHQMKAGAGNATIALPKTEFAQDGLSFAKLSPGFAGQVQTPSMLIGADVKANYSKGTPPVLKGVLDIPRMPMIGLMENALGRGASMEGTLKANVPFVFKTAKDWQLNGATIVNDGPATLTLLPMKKEAAQLIGTLAAVLAKKEVPAESAAQANKVNVRTLDLTLQSINNQGDLRVSGAIAGDNPMFRNDVSMQVNFTTNLEEMLRSMGSKAITKLQ